MRLIADRILNGDYGRKVPGDLIVCDEELGRQLIASGCAHEEKISIIYDNKALAVPEVGVVESPFRHVPVPDTQPAAVVEAGDPVLPKSDVPEQRAVNTGRRGTRRKLGGLR